MARAHQGGGQEGGGSERESKGRIEKGGGRKRKKEYDRRVRERGEKELERDTVKHREKAQRKVKRDVLLDHPHPFHSIFLSVKVTRKSYLYTEFTLLLYVSKREGTSLPLGVTRPRKA